MLVFKAVPCVVVSKWGKARPRWDAGTGGAERPRAGDLATLPSLTGCHRSSRGTAHSQELLQVKVTYKKGW